MVAATFKRTVVNPVKYVGPTKTKYLFRNFQFLKSSILPPYPNMLGKVKRNIKRIVTARLMSQAMPVMFDWDV